jgi:hypothetical protein
MVLSCFREGGRLIRFIPSVTPKKSGRKTALNPRLRGPEHRGGPWREAILFREEFAHGAKGKIVDRRGFCAGWLD